MQNVTKNIIVVVGFGKITDPITDDGFSTVCFFKKFNSRAMYS